MTYSFNRMKIRNKLLLITAIAFLGVTLLSAFPLISLKDRILTEKRLKTMHLVETAYGVVDHFYKLSQGGKISAEEAKLAAINTLKGLRYDNGVEYFWINDQHPKMIMHPIRPELDGKDLTDFKDPMGKHLFIEFATVVNNSKSGFVDYMWPKPGFQNPVPKTSYVKGFEPWGWIIGSGIYIDDVNAAFWQKARYLIVMMVIFAVIIAIVATLLVRKALYPLNSIIVTLKEISSNDQNVTRLDKRLNITSGDEISDAGKEVNILLEKMNHIMLKVADVTEQINTHVYTIDNNVDKQVGFATQLSSAVVEIAATMQEFSGSAAKIAQHSQSVVEQAEKTLVDTKHGANEVENLTSKFNLISQDLHVNLNEIVNLGRKSKEINKIMEIIGNIANQTKLIAFNAALEAASAGEAGKRFGVVAVEIRRLADNVVASTGEIDAKITEILDSVNRLVMSSDKSSLMIQEGQEFADRTVSLLSTIVDSMEETTQSAHQISLSTQQQQIASNQVVVALRDIEQGVCYSKDSAKNFSVVTSELAAMSENLKTIISTFKLKESE
ncbi:MAG: methyl-accepting chemotaxis protein [Pedobacter sp.]